MSYFDIPSIALTKRGQLSRSHFRVHLSLHFNARLSARSVLWKSVFIYIEIRTNYHNKDFALRLTLKERLRGTRKWPIVERSEVQLFARKQHYQNISPRIGSCQIQTLELQVQELQWTQVFAFDRMRLSTHKLKHYSSKIFFLRVARGSWCQQNKQLFGSTTELQEAGGVLYWHHKLLCDPKILWKHRMHISFWRKIRKRPMSLARSVVYSILHTSP